MSEVKWRKMEDVPPVAGWYLMALRWQNEKGYTVDRAGFFNGEWQTGAMHYRALAWAEMPALPLRFLEWIPIPELPKP